ncbi:MAG TPA: hypothetical protein IGR64_07455 [Leptolyngbyaceae cyanobacterium M65_K2018_010]|nr:hypothetical protein [Leptolyngbyaceae cyanobacterium M65_K2018_010]
MEVLFLVICAFVVWVLSTAIEHLPDLGQWLVPSRWLLLGAGLVLVTWLIRD